MTELPSLEVPAIAELAQLPQWLLWRKVERDGKTTKVPLTITGALASSTDPTTWSSFQDCADAFVRCVGDGLGFVFTPGGGYFGIDLDKCISSTGLFTHALRIVRELTSYTERSPSGEGLHIIGRGKLPPGRRRKDGIEMYDQDRFFTVTGDVWGGLDSIEDRTAEVAALHARVFKDAVNGERVKYESEPWDGTLPPRVTAAIENDPEIRRRWEGDASGLNDTSNSGIDLSLAALLKVRVGCSGPELEAALRARREKIGRQKHDGYFLQTVGAALASGAGNEKGEHLTDLGNARRFVAQHIRDVRYVPQWGEWIAYTGRRWQRDTTGEVVRRAKETSLSIYQEAFARANQEERVEYSKHAVRSESARSITAMLELAKTEPGIPVEPHQLDADPMLLNVLNGTIDLRTGILHAHDRADLCTKLAPVNFDPGASLPLFDEYLKTVVPDEEQRGFLKRCAGYSLTGSTSEERLLFIFGPEASGKSTFIETLKAALGDYAATADFETFLARRDVGGPRPDLARLAGARFVSSIEVEDGKRLAEGLVKLLTGGDTITVRELYQKAFEFRPQFTLWLAANDEPRIRDDDGAMWRRILQIPFTVSIPEEDRDPEIKATLRDPAVAGPAILAWAIEGCLDWQRIGLAPPKSILEATRAYRDRMDPIAEFLQDRCEGGSLHRVTSAALFAAYLEWCKAAVVRPLSKRSFGLRMAGKFDSASDGKARSWLGIKLATGV
jgi:putative DNA primase/helicase